MRVILKTQKKLVSVLIMTIFLTLLIAKTTKAQNFPDGDEYAVIGYKLLFDDKIDKKSLQKVFAMYIESWPDGKDVQIVDYKDDELDFKKDFYEFMEKPAFFYRRFWIKRQYSSNGLQPKIVRTKEEMLHFVSITPGAIGYVKIEDLTDDVKVLLTF